MIFNLRNNFITKTYLEQDEYAPVPRSNCNLYFTTVRKCYAISSSGSVAGRVRASSTVVSVTRPRR